MLRPQMDFKGRVAFDSRLHGYLPFFTLAQFAKMPEERSHGAGYLCASGQTSRHSGTCQMSSGLTIVSCGGYLEKVGHSISLE